MLEGVAAMCGWEGGLLFPGHVTAAFISSQQLGEVRRFATWNSNVLIYD